MVTTLYAGILGILYIGLSIFVIQGRFKNKASLGDGGVDDLQRRIRMHGNFIEYVPFALLLMIFAEFEGADENMIHAAGVGLVIARVMHAYGLYDANSPVIFRRGGMGLTFTILLIAALFCVQSYFFF